MKLLAFERSGARTLGILVEGRVVALDSLAPNLPKTMEQLLESGAAILARIADLSSGALGGVPVESVTLLAPLIRPGKFLGIGLNYLSHADELRAHGLVPDTTHQIWFNKQTSCITGPQDPIHLPAVSVQLDYEGELGIVIGRRCRHVAAADAHRVIAGYMVINDISVRDWQKRAPTATLGKSFDTHGPIGPWITTADEIPDPESLDIRTMVDGVVVQQGNSHDLIHGIAAMIAHLTTVMTLEPGDILATGTPSGVAQGRTPPTWLRAGQVVRVEIEGLGAIENRVVAEPVSETTTIV